MLKDLFVTIGATIAAVLAIILVVMLIAVGIWGFQWVTAPFRGSLDARERIQASRAFRVGAYESFFNACSSIQALEIDLDSQKQLLEITANDQRKEIIQANIAAITAARRRRYSAI